MWLSDQEMSVLFDLRHERGHVVQDDSGDDIRSLEREAATGDLGWK